MSWLKCIPSGEKEVICFVVLYLETGKTREKLPVGRCDQHLSRMLNFILTSWQSCRDLLISHYQERPFFTACLASCFSFSPALAKWKILSRAQRRLFAQKAICPRNNFCSSHHLANLVEKLLIWTEAKKTFMGKRRKRRGKKKGSHRRKKKPALSQIVDKSIGCGNKKIGKHITHHRFCWKISTA